MSEKKEETVFKKYFYYEKEKDINKTRVKFNFGLLPTFNLKTLFIILVLGFMIHSFKLEIFLSHFLDLFNKIIFSEYRKFFIINILIIVGFFFYYLKKNKPVYIVDFTVWRGEKGMETPTNEFAERSRKLNIYKEDTLNFFERILTRAGLSEKTYMSKGIKQFPFDTSYQAARDELEQVFTSCIDELFETTGIKPSQIDFLVCNCSLFNPTPSICATIINHYKMKESILSFNLAGMGCSAGLLAVKLGSELLQNRPNSYCLIFSTENVTKNWYFGNERSMIIQNALFRVGGAAILLTNKKFGVSHKYELDTIVTTHHGKDDQAFKSVYHMDDSQGNTGVFLSRDLMKVVSKALRSNMTSLGSKILPISEITKYLINFALRKFLKRKIEPYQPNFKKVIQHFCIHAGGRGILDGIEKDLKLNEYQMEPSRASLYRYGNTSSASIWYEFAFIEGRGNMKYGDKIWQIALGSGFKVNSAVWKSLISIPKTNVKPTFPEDEIEDEIKDNQN
ncbi:3-ketoacyl-coa synthase [Anaeramoeba ignava]|uniref:3-ketoacyl-CoA synthase n=1 Tax=Anaeramoeba ignava TaxID=1746090 RepID=A0A9Q0R6D7_ANAIG|nr:3-ketoacyl-coa synthase [Anaeramoeba ignava]